MNKIFWEDNDELNLGWFHQQCLRRGGVFDLAVEEEKGILFFGNGN